MPKLVLFGDNLTQSSFGAGGWGARLANAYQRKADVINRGFTGYTSRWALRLLDRAFVGHDKDLMLTTVWFGANDIAAASDVLRSNATHPHVPVKEYRSNLGEIGSRLQRLRAPAVLLLTPLPMPPPESLQPDDSQHQQAGVGAECWQRYHEVAGQYAGACMEAGQQLGVPTLDLWTALQEGKGWVQPLHPSSWDSGSELCLTPRGSRQLFKLLQSVVAAEFPHLRPEALPDDAPEPEHFAATAERQGFQQGFSLGTAGGAENGRW